MLPRFFAPDAGRARSDARVALPDEEAAHLSRVLRLKRGDRVRVFDGIGAEWLAEIDEVGRDRAAVRLLESVTPVPEPRIPITLAIAVLKGDKMDDVMRDAVMLGATSLQPLITERTEFTLATVVRSHRVARWQRIAVSSAKQCGRAVVPPVHEALPLESWLGAEVSGERFMLVEPGAASGPIEILHVDRPRAAELIVGPEGGWTEHEVADALRAKTRLVTMGARTLRADAMPIVALTALRTHWRDL